MTDQPHIPYTVAELGAKFGEHQAQAFGELIMLEKTVASLHAQIEVMKQNEGALIDHIQEIEVKLAVLESTHVDKSLDMSEELSMLAEEGTAILSESTADNEESSSIVNLCCSSGSGKPSCTSLAGNTDFAAHPGDSNCAG